MEFTWSFEYGYWRISYMNLDLRESEDDSGFTSDKSLDDKYTSDLDSSPQKSSLLRLTINLGFGVPGAFGSFFDLTEVDTSVVGMPEITIIAAMLELRLFDNFSIELGISWNKKGVELRCTDYIAIEGTNPSIYIYDDMWSIDYIQAPFLINLIYPIMKISNTESAIRIGAGVGINYAIIKSGEINTDDYTTESQAFNHYYSQFNNFNISLIIKAGFYFQYRKFGGGIIAVFDYHLLNDWADYYLPYSTNTHFMNLSVGPHFIILF